MTGDTVFPGGSLRDFPDMRLMAILALHVHAEMNLVLPDFRGARMTPQAIHILRLYLARGMRFMALITIELHGGVVGNLDLNRFLHG